MVLVHYIQPLIHPWADEYSTDRSTSQRLIGTAQRSYVSGQNLHHLHHLPPGALILTTTTTLSATETPPC